MSAFCCGACVILFMDYAFERNWFWVVVSGSGVIINGIGWIGS